MSSAVASTWHLSAALSWGHWSKVPSTGWLRITEIHSLRVLEAKGPKPRCLQDHAPSETCREGRFLPLLASGSCRHLSAWGSITPVSTWSSQGALSPHLSSGHGLFCKDTTQGMCLNLTTSEHTLTLVLTRSQGSLTSLWGTQSSDGAASPRLMSTGSGPEEGEVLFIHFLKSHTSKLVLSDPTLWAP